MVKVKIKTTVITSQYGTLLTGDELTTNAEFAKHLVDDCNAAEYITKPESPSENLSTSEAPAKHKSAGKSKKTI